MRCQDVQNQLRAFSIGKLPMDVRQTIQVHVSECAACRADLAKIDALAGVFAAAQTPPIPSGFSARVLAMARQRLETDKNEPWNMIRWWRVASAHACRSVGRDGYRPDNRPLDGDGFRAVAHSGRRPDAIRPG